MARINYKKIPKKVIASAALISILGAGGASILIDELVDKEGYVPEGYLDPVGIPTKCFGDTRDVIVGKQYTFDECSRSLNEHALELVIPLTTCIKGYSNLPEKTKAALASLTYNIGSGALCRGSVAKKINAGDLEGACRRIGEPGFYDSARGKKLPGLVKRRKFESEMCLQGLKEGK